MNSFLAICLVAFLAVASTEETKGTKIGAFSSYTHGIGGSVYVINEHTLLIKDFEYDGAGPDAFFWAGTSGQPDTVGTILPHPFSGKFFEYEDKSAPILEGRFDKVDITLTLPPTLKATDIKWLSVWCRAFKVNFGDIFFPEDFEIAAPEAEAEAESESEDESESDADAELPHPIVEITKNNVHDPKHRDNDNHGDADAESQAESEAEDDSKAESKPRGAAGNVAAAISSVAAALILSALF